MVSEALISVGNKFFFLFGNWTVINFTVPTSANERLRSMFQYRPLYYILYLA